MTATELEQAEQAMCAHARWIERQPPCLLCGCCESSATIHDFDGRNNIDIEVRLCANCLIGFTLLRLTPEQVAKWRAYAGGETYYTHGDFYNPDGVAVQPMLLRGEVEWFKTIDEIEGIDTPEPPTHQQ